MSAKNPSGASRAGGGQRRAEGWFLYVAECVDGSYYTGITKDVEKRIETHNSGKGSKYTAVHRPVKLIFQEPQADYSAALRREYQVKSLSKKRKIIFAQGEKLRRPPKKAKMSFQRKQKRTPKSNTKARRYKVKRFKAGSSE